MNGLEKFKELLFNDEGFQKKLKDASESYTGEKSEEAFFSNILVPLGTEYGISATYDEFKSYMEQLNNRELSTDEIRQVAGGDPKGFGATACYGFGIGFGGTQYPDGTQCVALGVGIGGAEACAGEGVRTGI